MAFPSPIQTEADPRHGNAARERLREIMGNLIVPENYRVVFYVDERTEKLVLEVQKRKAWTLHLWRWPIWSYRQSWEADEVIQRRITSRTYEGIIHELDQAPEWLEFELEVAGRLVYRAV